MAAAPIIFAVASAVASGATAYKALTAKQPAAPPAPTPPPPPADPSTLQTAAAQRRNRTLLVADAGTSKPSTLLAGSLGAAPTTRSTLLGM